MSHRLKSAAAALALLLSGSSLAQPDELESLRQQVADTERAFAQTMADRDHAAFTSFLADETVFFDGTTPLVGKDAVAAAWASFYEAPEPPFAWQPELVVVLASGTLAHSSGPVLAPDGQRIATFNSVWRREPSGEWKIVFDKGSRDCPPPE
jgi:ketosteroid isomerase-like protein